MGIMENMEITKTGLYRVCPKGPRTQIIGL